MKIPFSPIEMFVVRGGVEHGDERGRTLGFPTANLSIAGTTLDDGVWAGWADRGTSRHLAAISVGGRPTFYGREGFRLLEAHILDFNADLYDEVITVWLCHRLRGQRRFPSLESLVQQLHADMAACRNWHQAAAWHPPASSITDIPVGVALLMSA
jgi:riboflavin kinase/FMN adenylyltransferase